MNTTPPGELPAAKVQSKKRRRQHAVRVYVDPREAELIEQRAAATGLSASNFLRAVGLNQPLPASLFDQEAICALVRLAGDQGRLGGLLKQWLSARPGEGASEFDVSRLLDELLALQAELRERVASL